MRFAFICLLFMGMGSACVSTDPKDPSKPPPITQETPTEDAIAIALDYGGESLERVKILITKRGETAKVAKEMETFVMKGVERESDSRMIAAMHLYHIGIKSASIPLFQKLVSSEREIDRVLGWNLAANLPSPDIAKAMDAEFTKRVSSNEERFLLLPQMATAVQANRLTSAYTLVRLGLMERGDDAFAKAMISIAPNRVGDDFLAYLGKANIEELRQLNQTTVNVYTCLVILRHFSVNPVPVGSKDFSNLFLYAVSRNQGLSEVANLVLERLMPANKDFMALTLSQMPAWVQLAFIDDAARHKSPNLAFFLSELKDLTPHEEVAQEIEEMR